MTKSAVACNKSSHFVWKPECRLCIAYITSEVISHFAWNHATNLDWTFTLIQQVTIAYYSCKYRKGAPYDVFDLRYDIYASENFHIHTHTNFLWWSHLGKAERKRDLHWRRPWKRCIIVLIIQKQTTSQKRCVSATIQKTWGDSMAVLALRFRCCAGAVGVPEEKTLGVGCTTTLCALNFFVRPRSPAEVLSAAFTQRTHAHIHPLACSFDLRLATRLGWECRNSLLIQFSGPNLHPSACWFSLLFRQMGPTRLLY